MALLDLQYLYLIKYLELSYLLFALYFIDWILSIHSFSYIDPTVYTITCIKDFTPTLHPFLELKIPLSSLTTAH